MPKFIDITGEKFGEWTVLEYVGDSKWLCRCSCGEVKQVLGKTLRNGTSKTCGHSIVSVNIGDKCGELEVVDIISDKKCLVMCSCGKVGEAYIYDIMSGKRKDCGHGRSEKLRKRNESQREIWEGKKLYEWDILEYLGEHKYKCRCSCGKEKVVDIKLIKRGSSKSCGHNKGKSQIEDLSGKRFGSLIAKKYVGKKRWLCLCDCGKEHIVRRHALVTGDIKSCGCQRYAGSVGKEDILKAISEYQLENNEKPFVGDLITILNRDRGTINKSLKKYDIREYVDNSFESESERELYTLVGVKGIRRDRKVLDGKELDIYYDEYNVAVEFNGNYWHSDAFKSNSYHQKKTLECFKKGVELIHIFEYEWYNTASKEKIVKLIRRRLGVGDERVIYGRDTIVKEIGERESQEFLDRYHMQGNTGSSVRIGCYKGNELIGVMTFGKPRFRSEVEYELIRLAWKDDIRVVGGAEKLFNYFIRMYDPNEILTYCDIAKFSGRVYSKLGFKKYENGITRPNYVWVNNCRKVVMTRYQTMKKGLIKNNLGKENQTEDEIMRGFGFFKIYDCGNLKLLWKKECKENGR